MNSIPPHVVSLRTNVNSKPSPSPFYQMSTATQVILGRVMYVEHLVRVLQHRDRSPMTSGDETVFKFNWRSIIIQSLVRNQFRRVTEIGWRPNDEYADAAYS